MLNAIIDSLETKYFAVINDLTFKEVRSLEDAFKIRPFPYFAVKKENIGQTKSLFEDKFFSHSKYTLYDKDLNTFQINESNWRLIGIEGHILNDT